MALHHYFLSNVIYCRFIIFFSIRLPPHCVDVIYENKVFYFQIVDLYIGMYLHYIYLNIYFYVFPLITPHFY